MYVMGTTVHLGFVPGYSLVLFLSIKKPIPQFQQQHHRGVKNISLPLYVSNIYKGKSLIGPNCTLKYSCAIVTDVSRGAVHKKG